MSTTEGTHVPAATLEMRKRIKDWLEETPIGVVLSPIQLNGIEELFETSPNRVVGMMSGRLIQAKRRLIFAQYSPNGVAELTDSRVNNRRLLEYINRGNELFYELRVELALKAAGTIT